MAEQRLFPGGKTKAFTMSYDDGVLQDRRLVKLMNDYGIKGTFNLNSGFFGRKEHAMIDGFDTDISTVTGEEAAELYQGQEIAAHGLTHQNLIAVDEETVANEIRQDREALEELIRRSVTGFAYPFGTYSVSVEQALREHGIVYARTVENTGDFRLPKNFLEWHPTCHHNDERLYELAEQFCTQQADISKACDGTEGLQVFYLWGHSYEFDQRNNWDRIERLLEYVSKYRDEIWFATNGEIYEYVNALR